MMDKDAPRKLTFEKQISKLDQNKLSVDIDVDLTELSLLFEKSNGKSREHKRTSVCKSSNKKN